jgi:hypothetical protein
MNGGGDESDTQLSIIRSKKNLTNHLIKCKEEVHNICTMHLRNLCESWIIIPQIVKL